MTSLDYCVVKRKQVWTLVSNLLSQLFLRCSEQTDSMLLAKRFEITFEEMHTTLIMILLAIGILKCSLTMLVALLLGLRLAA